MTENEAKKIVQDIYAKEALFVMLSVARANMMSGKSVPYIGKKESGETSLFVFTSYERAKSCMDECGYEVLDGVYTIGRIEKTDKYRNLHAMFSIALAMGVAHVEFDMGSEDSFGCSIRWFLQANDLKQDAVSVLLSEEEMKKVMGNEMGIPARMNPVDIYEFSNPYKVSEERASAIIHHIFTAEEGATYGEFYDTFYEKETLHENCFVANYLNTKLIPMAMQKEKPEDVEGFRKVNSVIQLAVWNRLFEQGVFTLTDRETGELYVNDNSIYVLYTDLFKYMGKFNYSKLNSRNDLLQLIKEHEAERLVVTDGPYGMIVIEKSVWEDAQV